MGRRLRGAAITLAFWLAFPAQTRASDVPADQQSTILARALAYDRNLKARAGDEMRVAILVRSGDRASERDANSIYAMFRRLERARIQGLPFRVVKLQLSSPEALDQAVRDQDIDALYVTEGLSGSLPTIRQIARTRDVTTMASVAADVHDGLCMGVFVHDNKPRILLNRRAAKAEGASFAAGLLRVARLL